MDRKPPLSAKVPNVFISIKEQFRSSTNNPPPSLEIDLFTNLIVKIKSTTIYMDDKCFYTSNGTSKYLVFL